MILGLITQVKHLGLRSLFGLDIKTWGNLPSSKRWQSRDRGNWRILFELQWETPLWASQMRHFHCFSLYRGNLRILFELQWETPLCDPQIATVMRFWLFSLFRGNLRILFELQWETPLCDPQIATIMIFWLFSLLCVNLGFPTVAQKESSNCHDPAISTVLRVEGSPRF